MIFSSEIGAAATGNDYVRGNAGAGTAEVRWYTSGDNTFVEADLGDGIADLVVQITGSFALTESDFVL